MTKKKEVKNYVTIHDKTYPLIFGFKFLNAIHVLPKENADDENLTLLISGLLDGDPLALKDGVTAALNTYDDISQQDIEAYLETSDEIEELFENFMMCLTSAPLLKKKTKRIYEGLKKIQELMEQQAKAELAKAQKEIE